MKDTIIHNGWMLNDCVQKFVCLTTMETIKRRKRGENNLLDNLIEGVSRNVDLSNIKLDASFTKAIPRDLTGDKCNINDNCSVKIHPLQYYLI